MATVTPTASSATTTTISTFAAFAPIEPMKQSDLNEAGIKKCRDILRTRDANKNEYDKKNFFAVLRDYISMQFRIHNLWDPETQDHWDEFDVELIFSTLLRVYSDATAETASDQTSFQQVYEGLGTCTYPNIGQLTMPGFDVYSIKFNGKTIEIADISKFSKEEHAECVKRAFVGLKSGHGKNLNDSKTANYIVQQLKLMQDLTLENFLLKLGFQITYLKDCAIALSKCGWVRVLFEQSHHDKKRRERDDEELPVGRLSKLAVTDKAPSTELCTGCGRKGHSAAKCLAASYHPDFNRDPNIPWAQSQSDISWFGKGKTALPFTYDLAGNQYEAPAGLPKPLKEGKDGKKPTGKRPGSCKCIHCHYLSKLYTDSDHSPTIYCSLTSQTASLDTTALLDSGATRSSQ